MWDLVFAIGRVALVALFIKAPSSRVSRDSRDRRVDGRASANRAAFKAKAKGKYKGRKLIEAITRAPGIPVGMDPEATRGVRASLKESRKSSCGSGPPLPSR
jgi:hypothetical protein